MRAIPGYEGFYSIDESGNVWRDGAPRKRPLKPALTEGYPRVVLSKNGVKKNLFVHRLLMLAYVGPCPEGQEVRHLNGDRQDCRLENLTYGSHAENYADAVGHGRLGYGEAGPNVKLTESEVRDIRAATHGIRQLGTVYGVARSTIDAIRSRRIWPHI